MTVFVVIEDDGLGVGRLLVVVEVELATGAGDVFWQTRLHHPARHVDPMDTVVAYVSGPVVPVPVDGAVVVVAVEGEHRDGTVPKIVIDPGRDRFVLLVADVPALLGVPDLGHEQVADLARLAVLDESVGVGTAPGLGPHLHHPIVPACCLHHEAALTDVVGDGLFHVDILAGFTAENGSGSMPMEGGGDDDRVHRLVVQNPPDVLLHLGAFPLGFLRDLESGPHHVLVHVADVGQIHVGHLAEIPGQYRAAAPDAHHGHSHLVVGRDPLAAAQTGCSGRSNRRPAGQTRTEKTSPVHGITSWSGWMKY